MIAFGDPLLDKFNFPEDSETQINAIIAGVVAAMDTYCNRTFAQASSGLHDIYWPMQTNGEILVPAYPIVWVRNVYLNNNQILQIVGPGPTPSVNTSNMVTPAIRLTSVVDGVYTTTTLDYATYPTLGQLAAQINTISGWSASLNSQYDSLSSYDIVPGQNLQQNGCPLSIWDGTSVSQFSHDDWKGIIRVGLPMNWYMYDDWDTSNKMSPLAPPFFQDRVRVVYQGGYDDTNGPAWPADLNLCIAELTGFYYDGETGQYDSESFESKYSYSLAQDLDVIPKKAKKILLAYRDHTL